MSEVSEISPENFDLLASFIRKEAGIVLKPEKRQVVSLKLKPLVQGWGLKDLNDLVLHVYRQRSNPEVVDAVLNALTIKETSFFRDRRPFDALRQEILPALSEARGGRQLKMWSAACSTGQEPVSLAITLNEALGKVGSEHLVQGQLVGTDVSAAAIARAKEGIYGDLEIRRGVTPDVRRRYFQEVEGGWKPIPGILRMIRYREMNILEPDFPLPQFDLVLCRNVLIYFENREKKRALDHIHQRMRDDAYLLTGAGEEPHRVHDGFAQERVAGLQVFRKIPG